MHRREHNVGILLAMVLLALAYSALLHFRPGLTSRPTLDGSLGVLLGLYICSHPAANAVDLHFFHRGALDQVASSLSGLAWLGLNLLVLLAGWTVIVLGTSQLVGRAP